VVRINFHLCQPHQWLNFLRARRTIAWLLKARLQRHPLQTQRTSSRPWCPAPLALQRPTVLKAAASANAQQSVLLIQADASQGFNPPGASCNIFDDVCRQGFCPPVVIFVVSQRKKPCLPPREFAPFIFAHLVPIMRRPLAPFMVRMVPFVEENTCLLTKSPG
jgi:hypothetical protein